MVGFIASVITLAASAAAGVAKRLGDGGPGRIVRAVGYIYMQTAMLWNYSVGCIPLLRFGPELYSQHKWQAAAGLLLWTVAIGFAVWFRSILTAYAGSLVAYLSPYKDSKFDELRGQIQQVGQQVATLVYEGHKLPSQWIPKYEKVIILGHSPGSVIAYDTLNALMNAEAARNSPGTPNTVMSRTREFITFGSPLDKTAFLFRVQLKVGAGQLDSEGELRETMVSAAQPLIADYRQFRFDPTVLDHGPHWINISSPMDIISGKLDYYDDPGVGPREPQHVQNLIDRQAWIPIAAHNQYWTKKLLRKILYTEVFR
jgi:hypothetical protein